MKKCHIAYLACTAALLGSGLGATPATAAHRTLLVRPGESIQKAVDAAKTGDTVLVLPGNYFESIKVTTPGVTLRGSGRTTVIKPNPATPAPAKSDSGPMKLGDVQSCVANGNGICVVGTKKRNLTGVTISNLTVTGFIRNGVFGMATDGLTVRKVNAVDNGVWGLAEERSVRSVYRQNYASGNGDAGIFLANTVSAEEGATDTKGAVVEDNRLEKNRIGVTVRRLRNVSVSGNYVTGNCVGVFVVGDENKPRTGAVHVVDNSVVSNNKSCPKTERLPALQGSGVVLTGAEDSEVARNLITGNSGKSQLSGGVVLFKSFVGAKSERNRISDNLLDGNVPADLVNSETKARGNTFTGNKCRVSKPSGLC